jgi:hypothetical protein
MNDFFQSKFVQDLQNGKLPPVEASVTIPMETLAQICGAVFVTALLVLLVAKILKSV